MNATPSATQEGDKLTRAPVDVALPNGEDGMSRTRDVFSFANVVTALVAASMFVLAGVAVHREVVGPRGAAPARSDLAPERMTNGWPGIAAVGHRVGPPNAPLTVVVFSDYECPACRVFATQTAPEVLKRYTGRVAIVYRHWPLVEMHRFAYPTARAAECASNQGRFIQFHDVAFANQKLLGLKTYAEMAKEAGVVDLQTFARCVADTLPVAAIEADMRDVKQLKPVGTPTVIVNGILFRGGINLAKLDSIAGTAGVR